jgi:hypothetical protein
MKTNTETANRVIEVINETSFSTLFDRAFGKRKAKTMIYGNKKNNYESDDTEYAVMFNVENDELFILNYATKDNSWANTAASQNPWILVGYISALAVIADLCETHLIGNCEECIYNNEEQESRNY